MAPSSAHSASSCSSLDVPALFGGQRSLDALIAEPLNIDEDTSKLTEVLCRPSITHSLQVVNERCIADVLATATAVFAAERTLLRVHAPIRILGDLHGQYPDLLRILRARTQPAVA